MIAQFLTITENKRNRNLWSCWNWQVFFGQKSFRFCWCNRSVIFWQFDIKQTIYAQICLYHNWFVVFNSLTLNKLKDFIFGKTKICSISALCGFLSFWLKHCFRHFCNNSTLKRLGDAIQLTVVFSRFQR